MTWREAARARDTRAVLPNFIYIGPDKAGSSWLYKYLTYRNDTYVTPAKDVYFFDRHYGRGLEWYRRQFSNSAGHAVVAEICHDYLFSPLAAERIATDLPDARLMVSLREPVARAYSAYLNLRRHRRAGDSFESALERFPELVENGMYGRALKPFVDRVGLQRIHVGIFDDLQRTPQYFVDNLAEFLGLPPQALPTDLLVPEREAAAGRSVVAVRLARSGAAVVRSAGAPSLVGRLKNSRRVQRALYRPLRREERLPISSETQSHLRRIFTPDLMALSDLTGLDLLSRWGYEAGGKEPQC